MTLEESITFIADFFDPAIAPTLTTQKPILLENTTAILHFLTPHPE